MRYLAPAIVWCISASAQTPMPAPAAESSPSVRPQDKCSVEGTVINAATGEPVKKARVMLWQFSQDAEDPYATTTDAAGHFLIDEVDAGHYRLTASRSGYTQPRSSHGNPKAHAVLTLEEAQQMKDLVIKLAPEGVIGGRVLDEDGDPVAGVAIQCMSVGYEKGKHKLIGQGATNTNDVGEFRLPGLTAGKYVVSASVSPNQNKYELRPSQARGQAQVAEETYVTTYYPRTMNPNSASAIDVGPGSQISGINLTLLRARTVYIKGRVGAATQLHTQRIWVTFRPRDERHFGMPHNVTPRGDFELRGIVSGSYILRAGCVTREGKFYSARMPVEVQDSNIEGIELSLQPPTEFLGRVIIEDKGALRAATLNAWIQGNGVGMFPARSWDVKDDLTFKFDNVGRETYDFQLAGYPDSYYLKSVRMNDQDVTDTGLDFTQYAAAGELTVVLSPNAGIVEGSVRNAKDEAVSGAKVTLIPDLKHRSSTRYKIIDTDQNGHFVIKGVVPGDYKIYAWEDIEEGAYEDPDFMKPYESEGQTVSIKERGHETVKLKAIPAESAANEKLAR